MNTFNLDWKYFPYNVLETNDYSCGEIVNLPHTNKVLPLQYYDENAYQFVSSYLKEFTLEKKAHKRYILNFEGVMMKATLYVNNKYVNETVLGYLDFTNDITDYLVDGNNQILVITDSRESVNATPFGGLIDYQTFGGIYRDVTFSVKNETYIQNVKATYLNNLLTIELFTNNDDYKAVAISLNDKVYSFKKSSNNKYYITDLKKIVLWDIDNPKLYKINVAIKNDRYTFDFGFRTIAIKNNLLTLNGKVVKICGLNRHQSYPYIGYAAPKNMQVIDAEILKKLGVNLVRTSHYPQSKHFLDACDRLGLLVFEEIPGWQYLGDEEWKETVKANTKEMIMRDYNHPSIVIFGVRVNETVDCDDLYQETNRIAHELDKTRPTGGVRCYKNSHLYEDIYTYNEFSYNDERHVEEQQDITGLDYDVPYLITEFCGHTYPTKKIDNEERQIKQLLRHMRTQHAANKRDNMMGAIGWCAFDYNTHHQFGSGDKICYHGVMDIFRMPKLASMFYRGQIDRKDEIVLEVATIFGFGERNYGGVIPLYAFTNCDKVVMKMASGKELEFKIDEDYNSFKNPIFRLDSMDGSWGMDWKDATVYGYIDGKVVMEKPFLADQLPSNLDVKLYNQEIELNDATRIEVRMVDKVGNTLRFDSSILNIQVENGVLLSPEVVALYGGEYAFYVRSNNLGKLKVFLTCNNYHKELEIEVK